VARAWTDRVSALIAVAPADVCVVNVTEPKCHVPMAAAVVASRRSFASPTTNSWPIRCASVIAWNVRSTHEAVAGGLEVGAGVGFGVDAASPRDGEGDGLGSTVAAAVGDGVASASARASARSSRRPRGRAPARSRAR
jgi:hypothetical protein